jgi:hypothetical protein
LFESEGLNGFISQKIEVKEPQILAPFLFWPPIIKEMDIHIAFKIMGIMHCSVFYLKHDVSETGFCLRLQVDPISYSQSLSLDARNKTSKV